MYLTFQARANIINKQSSTNCDRYAQSGHNCQELGVVTVECEHPTPPTHSPGYHSECNGSQPSGNPSAPKSIKYRVPYSETFEARIILKYSVPTSQTTNYVPTTKVNQSMLFREILVAFYPVHHTKHTNTHCGNSDFNVKAGGSVHTLTNMF